MTGAELLVDAFGRIKEVVHDAVDGLTADQLAIRLDAEANSIGWLIWHLTRIQDDHVAGAAGIGQVYADGWWERLGRPFGERDHGYGHSSEQVGELRIPSAGRVAWLSRRGVRPDHRRRARAGRRRLRSRRRSGLGSPRHARRPAGQRHLRRSSARRPGRICPGPDRAGVSWGAGHTGRRAGNRGRRRRVAAR